MESAVKEKSRKEEEFEEQHILTHISSAIHENTVASCPFSFSFF
jgi:hypothetical protein